MFTGIIETTGIVSGMQPLERGVHLCIEADGFARDVAVGDSICVSGVCLTAVSLAGNRMEFDVVEETLSRTTLGALQEGDRVNLEKPVSLGTMLGGHLVQGHVDTVGVVREVESRGIEKWITIEAPEGISRYIVEKGSIALDGVSLTVAGVDNGSLSVAIIPHTAEVTTLGQCRRGSRLNLEVDMLVKYLEKLAAPYLASRSV